jgi:hypothetical protein
MAASKNKRTHTASSDVVQHPQVKVSNTTLAIGLIVLFSIIIIALFLTGKISPTLYGQGPTSKFASDAALIGSTQALQVNYSALYSSTLQSSSVNNISINYYKFGNSSKVVISNGGLILGFYWLYNIKKPFVCSQTSPTNPGSSVGCTTNLTSYSSFNTYLILQNVSDQVKFIQYADNAYKNFSLKYLGTSNILGKSCDEFSYSINSTELRTLQNYTGLNAFYPATQTGLPGTFYVNECINKQYGYPARLNISYVNYSSIQSKTISVPIVSLIATAVATNITSSIVMPPLNFSLNSASCTPTSVTLNVTSFVVSTNSTLKIINLSNQAVTSSYPYYINSYQNITLTLPSPPEFDHSYVIVARTMAPLVAAIHTAKVCMASSCQLTSCDIRNTTST